MVDIKDNVGNVLHQVDTNTMSKKFILITRSESGDDYHYFITHDKYPTKEELDEFLKNNGNDVDEDGYVYEHFEYCLEITDSNFINLK